MADTHKRKAGDQSFIRKVGEKEARRLRARHGAAHPVWYGLNMMGLVGWSVTVPTLAGAALGIWLDQRLPGAHSWTLTLLIAGLAAGCLNAWHWVAKEQRAIREAQEMAEKAERERAEREMTERETGRRKETEPEMGRGKEQR